MSSSMAFASSVMVPAGLSLSQRHNASMKSSLITSECPPAILASLLYMAVKLTSKDTLSLPLNVNTSPFSLIVGTLFYCCANMTRHDISALASLLIRFVSHPTCRRCEQAKRVLRYLSGTKEYCLIFTSTIFTDLLIWQDSSFAGGIRRFSCTGLLHPHNVRWPRLLEQHAPTQCYSLYYGGRIHGPYLPLPPRKLCSFVTFSTLSDSLSKARHLPSRTSKVASPSPPTT